jgi:hypothetical protein
LYDHASAGTQLGATGVGATGVGATGVGATGVGATGVGATGVGATGVGATGVGVAPQFAAGTEEDPEVPVAQFQPDPISPYDVCSASA